MRRPFGRWFLHRHTTDDGTEVLHDLTPQAWEVADPAPLLDAVKGDMRTLASVTDTPERVDVLDGRPWRPMRADDVDIVEIRPFSIGEVGEDADGNLWWRTDGGDWFPAEFEDEIRWALGWPRRDA